MFRLATFTLLFFFLLIQMNGQQLVSRYSSQDNTTSFNSDFNTNILSYNNSPGYQPVLIKFDRLPDIATHQKLVDSGIILEKYAGNYSYLGLIPVNIKDRLTEFGILEVKDWQLKPWLKNNRTL